MERWMYGLEKHLNYCKYACNDNLFYLSEICFIQPVLEFIKYRIYINEKRHNTAGIK